ncbi:hypothetical protein BU25DRAFT_455298 [Macroventuria anomochaeta]|uniref:Uncharacterized protein n=1 Tax=Macroventuria anomochaeta TaxID=301207 RepID=A0ACB6SCX9_9PLEO|nr:uncharacterized protein BU25DRAFT_455298 [Macroventuria anomochaeta]KAF2630952.1 hypothetical protein BU25DRAFT_455298 [Macroventuria anomochaeta]
MAGNDVSPYVPSKATAIISVIVFGVLSAIHILKLFKSKTRFCLPFVIDLTFEVLGYLARAYGHSHPNSLNPYIAQKLLVLLAPILFAASFYMFLGRIVLATGPTEASIVRPTWLTKIFLGGDILCFLVQAAGAGMLAKTDASKVTRDLGKIVVLAGLIIQLFVVVFFMVVAATFHMRARKIERIERHKEGCLLAHEWPTYIFDVLLMASALGVCTTWYVGDIVSRVTHGEAYVMAAHQPNHRGRV